MDLFCLGVFVSALPCTHARSSSPTHTHKNTTSCQYMQDGKMGCEQHWWTGTNHWRRPLSPAGSFSPPGKFLQSIKKKTSWKFLWESYVNIILVVLFYFISYLCFERSKTQPGKNVVIPLDRIIRLEKGNQYSWIPGGGMIIEVFVQGLDRV